MLEPIDHVLERIVVLVVEEITSWLDLDELFDQVLLGNVGQDHVLGVLVQDGEAIRDSGVVFTFLNLERSLDFIEVCALDELGMLNDFSERPVARGQVPLDDLLEVLVALFADGEL